VPLYILRNHAACVTGSGVMRQRLSVALGSEYRSRGPSSAFATSIAGVTPTSLPRAEGRLAPTIALTISALLERTTPMATEEAFGMNSGPAAGPDGRGSAPRRILGRGDDRVSGSVSQEDSAVAGAPNVPSMIEREHRTDPPSK
jgi:hypothetical protein